jgi:hypothetical protein
MAHSKSFLLQTGTGRNLRIYYTDVNNWSAKLPGDNMDVTGQLHQSAIDRIKREITKRLSETN